MTIDLAGKSTDALWTIRLDDFQPPYLRVRQSDWDGIDAELPVTSNISSLCIDVVSAVKSVDPELGERIHGGFKPREYP